MKKLSLLFSFLLILFFNGCSNTATGVSPQKGVKKVKKEYYTGGMLRSEFLMYDDTGMNGVRKHYGYEGKLTSIAEIRNGVKHGIEKWYDKEGRTIQTVPYDNGRKEGVQTAYYPNGTPMITTTFKKDIRHGPTVIYKRDGSIHEKIIYRNSKAVN